MQTKPIKEGGKLNLKRQSLFPDGKSKMAELFMECEEEELEPWQKKVKEVEDDDDDDEPIFVGEIASSKPAISSITAAFKPTSQHYTNPTSNPVAASPVNFHPESRSSDNSVIVQPLSKPMESIVSVTGDCHGAYVLKKKNGSIAFV
ncbi:Zinc finger protein 280D [Myotis brandtii]|uniref:Zinc finger protein 280D n=1 Tax=Myotis brandtii TaxID=109478 RepID=S7MV01_MYOBR|nr:Zinc finger protein 280D [Myotis brandtii]